MKFFYKTQLLATTLVISTIFGLINQNTAKAQVRIIRDNSDLRIIRTHRTTVSCRNLTTVISRAGRSAVLIKWQTTEFGKSPQQRCQIVSQKLQTAIDYNGGKLSGLRLITGRVNNQTVICFVPNGEVCNSSRVLLTLNRENRRRANEVAQKIISPSPNASNAAIIENSRERFEMDLGVWEETNLDPRVSTY